MNTAARRAGGNFPVSMRLVVVLPIGSEVVQLRKMTNFTVGKLFEANINIAH